MNDTRESRSNIRNAVRDFIFLEFLAGENPSFLADDTPLITGGVLDSISTARLVSFLEGEYRIRFKPHEVGADRLDTVERIVETIERKLGGTDDE